MLNASVGSCSNSVEGAGGVGVVEPFGAALADGVDVTLAELLAVGAVVDAAGIADGLTDGAPDGEGLDDGVPVSVGLADALGLWSCSHTSALLPWMTAGCSEYPDGQAGPGGPDGPVGPGSP